MDESLKPLNEFERLILHPTAWPTVEDHEVLLATAELDKELEGL